MRESLASIVKDIWQTPLNKDTIAKRFDQYKRPKNCDTIIIKRCNAEIWSELLSQNVRSKDLKTQKVQTGVIKGTIAITEVMDTLLNLKSNRDPSAKALRKALVPVIGICTDSIDILAHTNQHLEQHRRYSIVFTLDKSFRQLAKNVPAESIELFGDGLPKRLTTIKANRKLLSHTSTYTA